MKEFSENVRQWASDRNLIEGSDPMRQFGKLAEELVELFVAIQIDNRDSTIDAIGDCAVVLAVIAAQIGMTFDECCEAAWNEIKDRKGKMVDGVFVREQS